MDAMRSGEVFVQLVPVGDLFGAGAHPRHCYWFKQDAPWRKLLNAWAQENRWRPEDLQLTNDGQLVSLDSSPVSSGLMGDVSLSVAAKPGAQKLLCEVPTEVSSDTVKVRIVAYCDAGSTTLHFRAPRSIALRKLMIAWCTRQGLSLPEVNFRLGQAEVSPRDSLCTLAGQLSDLEILAEPRADVDCATVPTPTPVAAAAPAAPAAATPKAEPEENRVQVQIAAKGILAERVKQSQGSRTLSFKTKLFAPLGKVMALWCKHQNLLRDTVVFWSCGEQLPVDATAAGQGWSTQQPVVLDASLVNDQAAQEALQRMAVERAPPTPRPGPNVSLSVTVLCDNAEPVDFKMKATTSLEKMMNAWRQQCRVPPEGVVDFRDGERLLAPSDTPGSLGWPGRQEEITLKASTDALPVKAAAPVPPEATRDAAPEPTPEPLPEPMPEAAPVQEAGAKEAAPEKLSLEVVAEDQDGRHTVTFTLRPNSPLEKMMHAWCNASQVDPSQAVFEYRGREVRPEDTLQTLGCDQPDALREIRARPRREEDALPKQAAQPPSLPAAPPAPAAPAAPAAAAQQGAELPKVSLQVVAPAQDGSHTVTFTLRPTSTLEKMMKAWCKETQVDLSQAVFEYQGRVVRPEDTLQTLGYNDFTTSPVIHVRPVEEPRQPEQPPAEEVKPKPAPAAPAVEAPAGATAAASSELPKVSLQVVADDQDGSHTVTFTLRPTSTLEKMMKTWCKASEVELSQAVFEYQGKVVRPEDTLQTLGYNDFTTTPVIRVRPVQAEATSASTSDAAPAAAPTAPAAAPAAAPVPAVPAPMAPAAAATQQGGVEQLPKVTLEVVTPAQDGNHTVTFTLRPNSALEKMMKAWCKQTEVDLSQAVFEYQGKVVRPEDTLQTLGYNDFTTTPVIRVRPMEEQQEPEQPPPEAQAPEAAPAPPERGAAGPGTAAELPKVSLQVVAEDQDGSHTVTFTLRPNSPLEKMMNVWCKSSEVDLSQAVFEYQGKVVRPEDTLQSLGYSDFTVPPVIHVRPMEEPRDPPEPPTAKAPVEATAAAPPAAPAPAPAAPATQEGGQGDSVAAPLPKVSLQVVAPAQDGSHTVTFMLRPNSTLEKMMNAWCKETKVEQAQAIFEFQGKVVRPEDTLQTLGYSDFTTTPVIHVRPVKEQRAQELDSLLEGAGDKLPAAESAKPRRQPKRKASQGEAPAPKRAATAYQIFTKERRQALSTEQPGLKFGEVVKIISAEWKALTDEERRPFQESANKAKDELNASQAQPPQDTTGPAPPAAPAAPAADSAAPAPTSAAPGEGAVEKSRVVKVKILADGADGTNELSINMRFSTQLRKMMQAWCDHHQVPLEEADFLLGTRLLKSEDTWGSLASLVASSDEILVRAVPKGSEPVDPPQPTPAAPEVPTVEVADDETQPQPAAQAASSADAAASTAPAPAAPPAPPATPAPAVPAVPAAPSAQGGGEVEKPRVVQVKILAEGVDGTNELSINMRSSAPLRKMMQAWCQHHQVPLEEADFLLGTRLLKSEETWDSLGCSEDIVVKAVPKGSEDVEVEVSKPSTPRKAEAKAVAKPPKSAAARGRGRGRGRGKRKSRGGKSSDEGSDAEPPPNTAEAARRSKRLQESGDQVPMTNATLVHHSPPTPRKKDKEGTVATPTGEVSKRMSFREYLEFDREQEKMRNEARLARQKRKFVNGDSSDEELHLAMALSLSESQGESQPQGDEVPERSPLRSAVSPQPPAVPA